MKLAQAAMTCIGFSLATSSLPAISSIPFSKKSDLPNATPFAHQEAKFLNNFLANDLSIEESRSQFFTGKLKLKPEVQDYVDQYLKGFCGVDLTDCKDPNAKYVIRAFYMAIEAIEVKLTLGASDNELKDLIMLATDIAILAPQQMIENYSYRDKTRTSLIDISRELYSAASADRDLTAVDQNNLIAYRSIGTMLMAVRQVAQSELPESWNAGENWGRKNGRQDGVALGFCGALLAYGMFRAYNSRR